MADEAEDPNAAAERLEAALERIARLSALSRDAAAARALQAPVTLPESPVIVPRVAERLDSLIGRLREALGTQQ